MLHCTKLRVLWPANVFYLNLIGIPDQLCPIKGKDFSYYSWTKRYQKTCSLWSSRFCFHWGGFAYLHWRKCSFIYFAEFYKHFKVFVEVWYYALYYVLIILSIQLRWRWKFCFFKSWTMKKAEHQRIDAFELWCWKRLLRVPWTARRSSPEHSLEGLMLKLKLQYFRRTDSFEKTLILGKIEDRRKREWRGWDSWHHRPNGHEFKQALGVGDEQESLVCCSPWGCKLLDTTKWLKWRNWLKVTFTAPGGPDVFEGHYTANHIH